MLELEFICVAVRVDSFPILGYLIRYQLYLYFVVVVVVVFSLLFSVFVC